MSRNLPQQVSHLHLLYLKIIGLILKEWLISLRKYVLVSVCPQDGWVRYGNFGYLIINIRTLKWSDARRTCQMLGGDLAIIKSTDENNFVFTLLKKQKPSPIGVFGLVLFARRTTSSIGLMTLHWRKVTRLGQVSSQTILLEMKSVETCLARQKA